jgi:hypothetical protein
MRAFVVIDAADGTELGRASLDPERGLTMTGLAAEMIGGRIHGGGESERDAFDFYAAGWSNGYVLTKPVGAN